MSWFTDFISAIGKLSGFVNDAADRPKDAPKPVPITTEHSLGWDDEEPVTTPDLKIIPKGRPS